MFNENKVLCLIPARGGSKGIKNKNIYPILNRPLILWTILQAKQSKYIDDIFVSTDCKNIGSVCEQSGTEIIERPQNISGDNDSSESALVHSINFLKNERGLSYDLVVFLQCTSPLRKKGDIDSSIENFYNNQFDSLMSITEFDDLTLWSKENGELKSINFNYENRGMRQNRLSNLVENGSIYLFKPEVIFKYNNRLGGSIGTYKMDFWQTWEIDTYEEIDLMEFYLQKYIVNETTFLLNVKDIDLIAFDFDGVLTDNKVLVDENGTESVFANRSDGLAISMLKDLGIPVAVISTEKNEVVQKRCKKMKVDCYNGVENKLIQTKDICFKNNYDLEKVMFVGNDINDLEIMLNVGYPVCPSDANVKIRDISKIVLKTLGGDGVALELLTFFGGKGNENKK